MIDPLRITQYDRTQSDLEEFAIFTVLVAGKNSDSTARLVSRLLHNAPLDDETPIECLRRLDGLGSLHNYLVAHRVGQYGRILGALRGLFPLDLRTCTLDDLLAVPGIGPKTARFFLLHTRRDCDCAVLDTHVLRWMREACMVSEAPRSTPPEGPVYRKLERLALALMHGYYPECTPAEADLRIWTLMSGRLDNDPLPVPLLPGIKLADLPEESTHA